MSELAGRTLALLMGRLLALLGELGVAALLGEEAEERAPWVGRLLELALDVAAIGLGGWLRERTARRAAPECACRPAEERCRRAPASGGTEEKS